MGARLSDAVLPMSFGAVLTGFACPVIAPATDAVVSHGRFDLTILLTSFSWEKVWSFWASGEWLDRIPLVLAAFLVASAALWLYQEVKEAQMSRDVEGGVFGDAHIISGGRELSRRKDFWDGRGVPRRAGLVLGACRGGYWFDSSVPHALVTGKTGSGKTALLVLESMHLLLAAGWNVISTGKPEVLELTADKAEEMGYRVVLLDLNGYPGASGYNPLDLVVRCIEEGDVDAAVRHARQVSVDLIPLGGEKNTYFPKAARNVLTAAILVVCTAEIPRAQKNLASVAVLVQNGTSGEDPGDPAAPLKGYIRDLGPAHPAFAPASDLLGDGGATTAGKNVLSTLKEALSIFNDGALRAVTSESTVSIRELIESKSVIYIEMLDEGDPYQRVYSCFLNQWWTEAQRACRANGGLMPRDTAILGDEIGNIGSKVACLPAIATLGRSMRIHEYLFVQNEKQLNVYNEPGDGGAGRDKLIGSIGIKVALSLSEPEDFKFYTSLVGKKSVRSKGTSSQRGRGGGSASTSYSETAVPLINEWEWQNRIPIRDGLIAVVGGENSAPGREGVFEFPLEYAQNTPAGKFFGLGDPGHNRQKCADFYARASAKAGSAPAPPEPWCPMFDASACEEGDSGEVERDEWAAWD